MADFDVAEAMEILRRTPAVLDEWLRGLSEGWVMEDEGPETFSPCDVVGHLVHGEKADWIGRARIILEEGEWRTFDPFDRFAMYEESKEKTLPGHLDGPRPEPHRPDRPGHGEAVQGGSRAVQEVHPAVG